MKLLVCTDTRGVRECIVSKLPAIGDRIKLDVGTYVVNKLPYNVEVEKHWYGQKIVRAVVNADKEGL